METARQLPGRLARACRGARVGGGVVGDLARFFTVAALITFGGAYAVLPFVANQAVHHYGWLSSRRAAGAFGTALNGITIAVVGVIAALAVFVARHVVPTVIGCAVTGIVNALLR